jgi:2-iminobutanoate/2-iminopropanoate deaminase
MKLQKILMGAILAFCVAAHAADRKFIVKPRPAGLESVPFSDGVLIGNTLYMAGTIGLDPKTGQPPASAEDEARFAMEATKQTVEAAGLTMDDVVSIQVFCTDLKLYATFNNVYKTYFHGDFPARAFIGVDKLIRDGHFEVMGIAVKRSQ